MRVGTKSVLFGVHCVLIHWWFVALGWIYLFGFPFDPRVWVAFVVHDVGYFGKPNMDGPEGEAHVFVGARIMGALFDYGRWDSTWFASTVGRLIAAIFGRKAPGGTTWYCFAFYHSRFMAKKYETQPSPLCFADKMALTFEPHWLYLPRARWSGELREYMSGHDQSKGWSTIHYSDDEDIQRVWYERVATYCDAWVRTHVGGARDEWTHRERVSDSIVSQIARVAAISNDDARKGNV